MSLYAEPDGGFCAGADLGNINDGTAEAPLARRWKPGIVERLANLPQPVIAAVHGVCYTGGLELALAADLIVADASARFADTHGKWGLVGEWGMSQRLPRRVGTAAAKRMMFTGGPVTANDALRLGLIDVLCPSGGLDAAIGDLATAVLANSWHTNLHTKRLLRETGGMNLQDGLSHEHYRHPGFAPDWQDRIAAFAQTKTPDRVPRDR